MSWVFLTIAILSEVLGTVSMKYSEGFSRLWPSVFVFLFYGSALLFINLALKNIPLSVAYTIWAGLGTVLVAMVGIIYFDESANILKLASIALIVIGVVGLKLTTH